MKSSSTPYISTTNACKLCKPLGACLAFRGIEGAIPFLHGSQGCATYMRRYIISHFREPMDIASSSLGEKQAVYGGEANLKQGLRNVVSKYGARLIGIATTCLTETIGDDVPMILRAFRQEAEGGESGEDQPRVVHVSTPSYSGSHMEGFHAAVRAVVDQIAVPAEGPRRESRVNILPGFVSPADIRHLKEIFEEFGIEAILLPDISETMDGPALEDYQKLPEGGTPIEAIMDMGRSGCTLEFGRTMGERNTAGHLLQERFGVPHHAVGTPIGLRETDRFLRVLECAVERKTPRGILSERGRLVDSYADAHKVVFGKKAVVYGEEDLVVALASFLAEIGVKPVLCASGGQSGRLEKSVRAVTGDILPETPRVREGMDFHEIAEEAESLEPDLLIGHSKGYHLARKWKIPLVRVGFPIHDRFGGQRMLHVGYRGTQNLLDHIVNAFIEKKQGESPIGYGYM